MDVSIYVRSSVRNRWTHTSLPVPLGQKSRSSSKHLAASWLWWNCSRWETTKEKKGPEKLDFELLAIAFIRLNKPAGKNTSKRVGESNLGHVGKSVGWLKR